MTTSISNKILNRDEILEADPLEKIAAFQNMLCNACQIQNAGQCVKDNGECPVDTVGRAYKRAS
ncbi:MAG: hypothetical protein ACXVIU_12570 [Halobacteriota archaeon]